MDDCISREKAMMMAFNLERLAQGDGDISRGWKAACFTMRDRLKNMESRRSSPQKSGRWIPTEFPHMAECVDCSECGFRTVFGLRYRYCPGCGAKMEGT